MQSSFSGVPFIALNKGILQPQIDTRVQGNTATWQLLKLVCESDPCIPFFIATYTKNTKKK